MFAWRYLGLVATMMVACVYDWNALDPRAGGGGGPTTSGLGGASSSTTSPSSSSTTVGTGGTGGAGGFGGAGGATAVCGDGTVGGDEQCDDGGTVAGDGCDEHCAVECDQLLHPVTFHCYAFASAHLSWGSSQTACEARGPGWTLAGITNADELSWLASNSAIAAELAASVFIWIGGQDQQTEGQFSYLNEEPFPLDLWHDMQPDDYMMNEDCVDIWRKPSGLILLNDDDCSEVNASICERRPAGVSP